MLTVERVTEAWMCHRKYVDPEEIDRRGSWRIIVPSPVEPSTGPEESIPQDAVECAAEIMVVPTFLRYRGGTFKGWIVSWNGQEIDRLSYIRLPW